MAYIAKKMEDTIGIKNITQLKDKVPINQSRAKIENRFRRLIKTHYIAFDNSSNTVCREE